MIISWNRGLLMSPENGVPAGGTAGASAGAMVSDEGQPPEPPPPVAPPAAPPPPVPAPDAGISMTSDQLNQRMVRDRQAQLQRMGFENEAELVAMRERDQASRDEAEAARVATLSREQALQEEVSARTQERNAFEAERDDLRFQAHVAGICANVGVRNLSYATHMVQEAAESLGEDDELDVEAFFRERLDPENAEHAQTRAALGIEGPVVTNPVAVTTTGAGDPPPVPPPAGGGDPAPDDSMAMDRAAWTAKKESLGIA